MPYRETSATETLTARTRDGDVHLDVAPRHTLLRVGDHTELSVSEHYASLTRVGRKGKRKKRNIELKNGGDGDDHRLLVARGVPLGDVGIWYESQPGVAARLFGIQPLEMLDQEALDELRALDRVATQLAAALARHGHGVRHSYEIGPGADRVLIMDFGPRLVLHVRRLFREAPRRALEVHDDGTVLLPGRGGDKRFHCDWHLGVSVAGDNIRFTARNGADLGSVAIPWIRPEERAEIATLIGRLIDEG